MEYISSAEVSTRWGVSLRQVQRLAAAGRIPSAQKIGGSWVVPAGEAKPGDSRREKKCPRCSLSADLASLIAATARPAPAYQQDAIRDTLGEPRLYLQYEGALAYLRGDFARTMRCYEEMKGDEAARLRAAPLAVAAAISLGDSCAYGEIESFLQEYRAAGAADIAAYAELGLASAAVSVIAPQLVPGWLREGDLKLLPPQALPEALYLRAKYFQCMGQHEAALAVAQTVLSLGPSELEITLTGFYLQMVCAVSCCYLGRTEEARRRLLAAMRIALPHGFITPFAELVTALGGLVEQCLKQEYPGLYDAVIGQWERTWKNWTVFHNRFTMEHITLMLSPREYHIALQAARRVPYAKIAQQHSISIGRVKNIMLVIYEKLCISSRNELAKFLY